MSNYEISCSGIESSDKNEILTEEEAITEVKEGFSVLEGKIITKIEGAEKDSERIIFHTKCGKIYLMWHDQDCCESVSVEDICGDINDIIGEVIVSAYKSSNRTDPVAKNDYESDSYTWTFYNINTIKGSLTIRWYGTSNGYYSEEVDFEEIY